MLRSAHYRVEDPAQVRRLIAAHPWATIVSPTTTGLVASHYPVLLEEAGQEEIVLLSHVGRPDDEHHELGRHEVLVVVAGPHGYVSPSWYAPGDLVPTWNHLTAHLWGVPEVLGEEENYEVLCRLTEHFERGRPGGRDLREDEAATRRAARGTRGLRLRVTRFEARWKLSQTKTPEVAENVARQLEAVHPELAAEVRAVRAGGGCPGHR
ncbi:FMN-binding negative transcriptional regulator [Kineococcus aurantiacus]|uniref:Transcriptional regulator n=1 Tax=Kineococcus aurantiacus TaxID=37633 RepID=A0A7Y9DPD3_9ACTN|nr:FMN-binding negative transcriptional regulator [Kineococcus aurantiacus]NYD24342.1 transcriptional regulator [Kineococcus aurantiacus]